MRDGRVCPSCGAKRAAQLAAFLQDEVVEQVGQFHVHALCSRGGWAASGEWMPLPYVDEGAAEKLFRHKVLALLRRRGLLSQERIDLLNSWRRSGFSVHNRVFVHPRDGREFEALVRHMMRPPVSLARLHFTPGSHEVVNVPSRRLGRALLSGPGARGRSDTGRTVPRRPPAPVGPARDSRAARRGRRVGPSSVPRP